MPPHPSALGHSHREVETPFVWLALLFFASGISGLVYQTVWLRMLIRSLGVTVYAVTIVVTVFMAGLALGSLLVARVVRRRSFAMLRLYALIEILIGVFGALSTKLMILLPGAFCGLTAASGGDLGASLVRMGMAAVVLLPPTILMGATLPVLSGVLARDDAARRRAGVLYGSNTLGAVLGVMLTGFFLIAILGETRSVLAAAAINTLVGILAFLLARSTPSTESRCEDAPALPDISRDAAATARNVVAVMTMSGFCALALEVIWARLLASLLGNSVYGFSAMLGAYLFGIAAGSLLMARWLHKIRRPLLVLGALELGAAILALASLRIFTKLGLGDQDVRHSYAFLWELRDFGRLLTFSTLIVLPVTLVYGAIFPLATRLVAPLGSRMEATLGRLYGLNTVGGIIGTLVAGLVLIPVLGTLLGFLAVCFAVFALGLWILRLAARAEPGRGIRHVGLVAGLLFISAVSVSFEDPFLTVVLARVGSPTSKLVAHQEDRGATVTVLESAEGTRTLYINGLYTSNTSPGLAELMVNVPLAFDAEPGPKRILAVGLGVGEALRYAVDAGHYVTVVELHRAVLDAFRRLNLDAGKYLDSGRSSVIVEDGRNFLLRTQEAFDLVLVDGSPPLYASGMANLYSVEFMTLVKQHLRPNGVFGLWFPVVCFESDFWNVFRSFSETFPWTHLYSAPRGANAFIMGARAASDPFSIDFNTFAARLERWPGAKPPLPPGLLWAASRYDRTVLLRHAAQYPAATDDRPYTEFPLQGFLRGEPYLRDNRFLADAFMRK